MSQPKEIEINGLFEDSKFEISSFRVDEIEILFNKGDKFVKNYNSDGIFFCTDVKSVNEPIRSELLKMNVKSFLQVLMYTEDGEVLGCLGANAIYVRLWDQRELDTFVALAKIITKTVRELQAICVKELEETGKVEWE